MANYLNYQYFIDQWEIVPLNRTTQDNLAYRQDIDQYITRYETECLKKFLGYNEDETDNFYNLFIAGVTAGTAKYTALKNKLIDATNFKSPIAGYIWWYWVKFHRGSIINTDNPVKTIPAGMVTIDDTEQLCASWNHMVDMFGEVHDWLIANASTYPDYDHSENYFKYINQFGI